jgi:hypothetical protein
LNFLNVGILIFNAKGLGWLRPKVSFVPPERYATSDVMDDYLLRTYYGFTTLTIDDRIETGSVWAPTHYHVEGSGMSIMINPDVTAS